MGAICSGQSKQKKLISEDKGTQMEQPQIQIQQAPQVVYHKSKHHSTLPPTLSIFQNETIPQTTKTINLLLAQKQLKGQLESLGSLDQLTVITREKLIKLITLHSHIATLTLNTIKRAHRELKIVKKVEPGDEDYIHSDVRFGLYLSLQMGQVCDMIFLLEKDADFEESFPMLSYSFIELRNNIIQIQSQSGIVVNKLQDSPQNQTQTKAKQNDLKKISDESQLPIIRSTTNRITSN